MSFAAWWMRKFRTGSGWMVGSGTVRLQYIASKAMLGLSPYWSLSLIIGRVELSIRRELAVGVRP